MPPGSIRSALIGLVLLVSTSCVSSRMSTRDIYAELIGGGIVCTPVAVARVEQRQDEHFNERMRALRPWLESQIGAAEIAEMRRAVNEEMASVYFTGCPSEEAHSHLRTRQWMLLHELESRSRHGRAIVRGGGRS